MEDIKLYIDLSADFQIASTVCTDVARTVQIPDIVAVNICHNKVNLLISQFHNIEDSYYRKVEWNAKLISNSGSNVMYYPVEIGARGCISKDN